MTKLPLAKASPDTATLLPRIRPLQCLNAKVTNHSQCYFDGVLRVADERYFLERMPFTELSVGHDGPENDSVDGQMWIRSSQNDCIGRELYYKLGKPSKCYARYFSIFCLDLELCQVRRGFPRGAL